MDVALTAIISFLSALSAFLFAFAIYKRNLKQDAKSEATNDAVILTEIGYIKSGIDDIKKKQEVEDKRYLEIVSRVSAIEARMDEIHGHS